MGQPTTFAAARRASITAAVTALAVCVSGCGILGKSSDPPAVAEFVVSSPQLRDGDPLPSGYSCHGTQGNPPLRWSFVPADAKSIAIVVDDSSLAGSQVHWVLFDIPPGTTEVPENIADNLPDGARQGQTSQGTAAYVPPCNPQGTYRFSVYALREKVVTNGKSAPLSLSEGLLQDIASQTIARGRLTATGIESPRENRR
ncbi:hypothetical protein SAMN05421505_1149 [Sinosporangium album]|uniref:Phospholipid-binding protein, PBP family n=1 Tax=Sinosporangium album TaxID=504805 RepID=A0A1G8BDA8_9ACTN|nr:YbhB/YbcL family Raf kinase inhibitor-like protein [Sinosporangium album]SDH31168.1 hypothetical protein SAMN05421505_1149 [Sinosporangium album]